MRDVILAKVGGEVKTSNPRKGHFKSLLSEEISGAKVTVTRGWASVDATVDGSTPFHFVDTHLESFDPQTVVPSIRAQQAAELVAPSGPLTDPLPTILVGDLNSDTKTAVQPGDGQAYETLVKAGMRERSTYEPLGCCLATSLLPVGRRRRREPVRPQGRPHHDPRPEDGEAGQQLGHRPLTPERLLGLRPRRPLQHPEAPALMLMGRKPVR